MVAPGWCVPWSRRLPPGPRFRTPHAYLGGKEAFRPVFAQGGQAPGSRALACTDGLLSCRQNFVQFVWGRQRGAGHGQMKMLWRPSRDPAAWSPRGGSQEPGKASYGHPGGQAASVDTQSPAPPAGPSHGEGVRASNKPSAILEGGSLDVRRGARLGVRVVSGRGRDCPGHGAAGGTGPGERGGPLTERHLVHGPLFLHAGHGRRLLLILCGQRKWLWPRGTPGGGAERSGARGRRREWGSEGPGRGGVGMGALPPVLCPLTTLLLPGGD